jgi:hypothetical protein
MAHQYLVLLVNTPCLTQSAVPHIPPLNLPHPPLPIGHLHHPCSAFLTGTNTECGALSIWFFGQNPLPPTTKFPPYTSSIGHPHPHHFTFQMGTSTKRRAPVFGFLGQSPPPHLISSSLPPTIGFIDNLNQQLVPHQLMGTQTLVPY